MSLLELLPPFGIVCFLLGFLLGIKGMLALRWEQEMRAAIRSSMARSERLRKERDS